MLDFGAVRAGAEALPLTFTLRNLSDDELELGKPVVLRSIGEPFHHEGGSLENLKMEARGHHSVTVGYKPRGEGMSETTLNLGTRSPVWQGEATLQLKGRAVKRILGVAPEVLDFGWVEVGKPMPTQEIAITNLSVHTQKVWVSLKGGSASFVMGTKALDAPLPPGGAATFTVGCVPQEAGLVGDEVRISLEGDAVADAVIPVTCQGRQQQWSGSGGGCSSGGAQLGLLALVGLGSLRRRRGGGGGA